MTASLHSLKAVLFDLDGTLLDTAPDFAAVVNKMLQLHAKPQLDYSVIRPTVSMGSKAMLNLSFGIDESDSDFEKMRQHFLDLYSEHLAVYTKPFDGIIELLDWLDSKQLPWGIVTNKPRLYTKPLLEKLGLSKRSKVTVCPDDVTQTKPDPESLLLACRKLQCKTEQAIYIGDHRRDIEAGKNAKMRTIAAKYGYIETDDRIEDWSADFYADHANELLPILQSLL